MDSNQPNLTDATDRDFDTKPVLEDVRRVLDLESEAIARASSQLDGSVVEAVKLIFQGRGRVIVTGMGKMSCIARKAVATFCSTGTPAVFLHPSEAVHGDLGIVTTDDIVLALSNSGETREVLELIPHLTRQGVRSIAITAQSSCSLARVCDVAVSTGVASEADSIAVAPTNSTTVTLALCDGLAVALMNLRGFTAEQFAIFHPGGYLGGKLLLKVADVMHVGDSIPTTEPTSSLKAAIAAISSGKMGAVFVVDEKNKIMGVLTDGDLRRLIELSADENSGNVLGLPVSKHMNASPYTIGKDALAAEALKEMEDNGITVLPVVNESQIVVGVLHLHDLIRAGLA